MARPPKSIEERFWKKVNIRSDDECWEWQGNHHPYGRLFVRDGHHIQASQFSWELHNKQEVPNGILVCHSCDNPPCVNPKHLFLGTYFDNMQDKIRKGRDRYSPAIGERNGKHKLSDKEILDIRSKYANGASCIELAKAYGIHRVHITRIVFGKRRQYVK